MGATSATSCLSRRRGQGYGPYPGYQTMWPYTPGYLVGLMYLRDPERVQQVLEGARRGH